MKNKLSILSFLIAVLSLSSCTSQQEIFSSDSDKYLELYKSAYAQASEAIGNTRGNVISEDEVTEEEINSINNLETLVAYPYERLLQIEESPIYIQKCEAGLNHQQEVLFDFFQTYSYRDYKKIIDFVSSYIKAGTHTPSLISRYVTSAHDELINQCMAISAALIDAYGEETTWKDTLQTALLTPCEEVAIERIGILFASLGIQVALTTLMPITSFMAFVTTIDAICQLITIHNELVLCERNSKKN